MQFKKIPCFDLSLPVVSFGGASLSGEGGGYGFGAMSEEEAQKLIKSAYDAGIRVFDTAPIYGHGLSEERLGRYLPKDAWVVSKSGVDWHDTKRVNMTNSKEVTERMLQESLKRLKREQIDIYMVHWPDSRVDIRVPLEVLRKAQILGKIKHIGLCNTNTMDLKKAQEICEVKVIQSELNVFNQSAYNLLEDEWKDKFSMGWGTFDKGILTGRVDGERKFSKEDCRSWAPWWDKKVVAHKIERTKQLRLILADDHLSLTDFCLHYALNYYGLSTCLIGFKSAGDILEVTLSLQKKISREKMEGILNLWR